MKVFVLDTERWLRGEYGASWLLRPTDGKMCCQGQRCMMLGVKEIEGKFLIGELEDRDADDDGPLYPHPDLNDAVDQAAYEPNDESGLGDEERVEKINRALSKNGATYRFALPTNEHPAMTVYEE